MEPAVLGSVYWILRIVLLLFGGRGRAVLGRIAPRIGRLNLVIEPQVPVNFAGENPPYHMLSLLEETRTLPSNGHPARLGLVVKYPGQADAYIAGRQNFISTTQNGGPRWVHQGWAVAPGGYEVRLRFKSAGNKSAEVRLNVWNDGAQGALRSDLAPLSTV